MRTSKSIVTFRAPFTLNDLIGELPEGTYDIEVDEEEILGADRIAYRRIATHLFAQSRGATRTLTVDRNQLEAALQRDAA